MAGGTDDIRLEITGDIKSAKKTVKSFEKLIRRFEKANRRSKRRRVQEEKRTSKQVIRTNAAENRRLLAMQRRLSRKRARNRLRAMRQRKREHAKMLREIERAERRSARRRARMMRGAMRFGGRGLGLLGIGGAAGVIFQGREIMRFDEGLARLAAQANVSRKKQMEIREEINRSTLAYGAQRDVLLRVFEEIVDKSGNLTLAADNVERLSMQLRGTKVEAEHLGQLYAALNNAFRDTGRDLSTKEVADFVEILVAQGDKGQINLANMAGSAEKLFGAFKSAGLRTRKDLINFGALIQTAGETGSPEEASTAAVRFLSELTKQRKKLAKFGVSIFKPGTNEELKELDVLITEILDKTGGKVTALQEIFTERAIKPIKLLGTEYKNTGGRIDSFTRSIRLGNDAAGETERKFKRVAETSSQGFERMAAAFRLFADKALVDVMNDVADGVQKLVDNPDKMREFLRYAKDISVTLQAAGDAALVILKLLAMPKRAISGALDLYFENPIVKHMAERKGEKAAEKKIEEIMLELNINTDIKTDPAGNVTREVVTATLNNKDRGISKVITAGKL